MGDDDAEGKVKNFLIKSLISILWLFWLFCCSLAGYMLGQFTRDNWVVGWLFNASLVIGLLFAIVSGCFTIEHFLSKYLDKSGMEVKDGKRYEKRS